MASVTNNAPSARHCCNVTMQTMAHGLKQFGSWLGVQVKKVVDLAKPHFKQLGETLKMASHIAWGHTKTFFYNYRKEFALVALGAGIVGLAVGLVHAIRYCCKAEEPEDDTHTPDGAHTPVSRAPVSSATTAALLSSTVASGSSSAMPSAFAPPSASLTHPATSSTATGSLTDPTLDTSAFGAFDPNATAYATQVDMTQLPPHAMRMASSAHSHHQIHPQGAYPAPLRTTSVYSQPHGMHPGFPPAAHPMGPMMVHPQQLQLLRMQSQMVPGGAGQHPSQPPMTRPNTMVPPQPITMPAPSSMSSSAAAPALQPLPIATQTQQMAPVQSSSSASSTTSDAAAAAAAGTTTVQL
ncbi:MAG: hypothetical protein JSS32_04095 [Verrucomicrobia bacterium]|nr:hypothetical protein [Verrucomicrobiota bacterium]